MERQTHMKIIIMIPKSYAMTSNSHGILYTFFFSIDPLLEKIKRYYNGDSGLVL